MSINAHTAERCLLAPILEALAHNQQQARLISNPTPEIDSACEHMHAALHGWGTPGGKQHLREAFQLLVEIGTSNQLENTEQRTVAGTADQLAKNLRNTRQTGARQTLTAKAIARELRDPLSRLRADGSGPVEDLKTLRRVTGQVTREQLLSVTVRHELGVTKFTLLAQLVEARTTV